MSNCASKFGRVGSFPCGDHFSGGRFTRGLAMAAEITIRRILKVNHAGEFGAIRIYGAQIAVARR
jgi:demethoxyubiquinone hydroxylase (CLK1/Coq7/Cat5 family)